MNRSIATINADVAQSEFGARGQGIVWAVIACGVESSHTHFAAHQNLVLPAGLSHWDFSDSEGLVVSHCQLSPTFMALAQALPP